MQTRFPKAGSEIQNPKSKIQVHPVSTTGTGIFGRRADCELKGFSRSAVHHAMDLKRDLKKDSKKRI